MAVFFAHVRNQTKNFGGDPSQTFAIDKGEKRLGRGAGGAKWAGSVLCPSLLLVSGKTLSPVFSPLIGPVRLEIHRPLVAVCAGIPPDSEAIDHLAIEAIPFSTPPPYTQNIIPHQSTNMASTLAIGAGVAVAAFLVRTLHPEA